MYKMAILKLEEMLKEFAGVKVFEDILMMFRSWCYDNIVNPITAGEVYENVVYSVIFASVCNVVGYNCNNIYK